MTDAEAWKLYYRDYCTRWAKYRDLEKAVEELEQAIINEVGIEDAFAYLKRVVREKDAACTALNKTTRACLEAGARLPYGIYEDLIYD